MRNNEIKKKGLTKIYIIILNVYRCEMYLGDQVLGHNPLFETQSAHFPATTKVIKLDLLKKKV